MSDTRYNGWANYETWAVALWIDNEEPTYHYRCLLARQAIDVYELSQTLKAWVERLAPDLGASLFSDLLNAALSEVDWYEIAEHWYAEAHEDDEVDNELNNE